MYTPKDQDALLKPYHSFYRAYRLYDGRWHREAWGTLSELTNWLEQMGFTFLQSLSGQSEPCGYYRIEQEEPSTPTDADAWDIYMSQF